MVEDTVYIELLVEWALHPRRGASGLILRVGMHFKMNRALPDESGFSLICSTGIWAVPRAEALGGACTLRRGVDCHISWD